MLHPHSSINYDPNVNISDVSLVEKLGDSVLLGKWFVFLKADWLKRSGMDKVLATSGITGVNPRPAVLFRGREELALPGATILPTPLPRPSLISLTCDKALYRVNHDRVRLLVAAPEHARQHLTLRLRLNGNPYADYALTLDEYGMYLWSMQQLPEGVYEARLDVEDSNVSSGAERNSSVPVCRFEVAEYRLAPLNAELVDSQLSGETLRYVLSITTFGQAYRGSIEVELQERDQRVGKRERLDCNGDGRCRGVVKLSGAGPYTLNVFAGERTATVVLKGSEQERRETLIISELGELRVLSLLPLPQSNSCRGVYIARGGANNEPFLVRRVIGSEVEITARVEAELLRVVVVDPAHGTSEEMVYESLGAEKSVRLSIPLPYGIVLLGAFIDGQVWEGWCAVLRPSGLQLECEAPRQAKPGESITITLKTGRADRVVPVQLIVKDQRVVAPSDPQVELAACIKENLGTWREQASTGEIERELAQLIGRPWPFAGGPHVRTMAMPLAAAPQGAPGIEGFPQFAMANGPGSVTVPAAVPTGMLQPRAEVGIVSRVATTRIAQTAVAAPAIPTLATVRLQFPEVVYNKIVKVEGTASVEVKLGESMGRYSIEAFALSPESLDWERVETTVDTTQPVYGELTVSPFVFPGDPVLGRLDVGAASGSAIVEVRHDGEALPLFLEDGSPVTPGLPIPSGSVVRFPVRPGAITAVVRDARKGGIDVSERYVTEPGKLRHILRRLRILTPGEEVTVQELQALEIKPLPGLERPFQFFVEQASRYPYGCIEQTSTKILAMYIGYFTNLANKEVAREYEEAIQVWFQRLKSMYLPHKGFCMYPPEEGGARTPDTHYAPLGVKHLLDLPTGAYSGIKQGSVRELLDEIRAMAKDAAGYYKIEFPPKKISSCRDAYQVLLHESSQKDRDKAAGYVRSRLREHNGQVYVEVSNDQSSYHWLGSAVATREETAYAAAALLVAGEASDLPAAIAATNYLTSQFNEEGRLYSTVDTAACLALMLALRDAGLVSSAEDGRVLLNGQEMRLAEALSYDGKVESLRCIEGVIAAQVTSEVVEDWGTFQSHLRVEVRLERDGQRRERFKVGDALDLVIRVPRYEPGMIAHVCLPDALARIVGGGQVKRFSLDFCEKNELRLPLAAVGSTFLPAGKNAAVENELRRWPGTSGKEGYVQHWAVIVRNMFKEEQVGNPGLLTVSVE